MNEALIDTDIFSEMTRAIDPAVVAHASSYRQAFSRDTISVVTFMEIVRGDHRKQATRQLHAFLAAIASEEVLPFHPSDAELAGRIAGELERVGRPIGPADPMIAAIALNHGLDLVTGNTAHFRRIQELGHPLGLVNWRSLPS